MLAVVEDRTGATLSGAEVSVFTADGTLLEELESDDGGIARVRVQQPGVFRIKVSKDYHMTVVVTLPIPSPRFTVRVPRLGVVAGNVRTVTGEPVRGAHVRVFAEGEDGRLSLASYPVTAARTDDQGAYRIAGLSPGRYAVAATPAVSIGSGEAGGGGVTTSIRRVLIEGGDEHHGLDLEATVGNRTIQGMVRLPDSSVTALVAVVRRDEPAILAASAMTTGDGSFVLRGLSEGSYELLAAAPVLGIGLAGAVLGPDRLFGRAKVDLSGDVSDVLIEMQSSAPVVVRLNEAGGTKGPACSGAFSARVAPLEAWGAMLTQSTRLQLGATVTLKGLPPGGTRVTAAAPMGTGCSVFGGTFDTRKTEHVSLPVGEPGGLSVRVQLQHAPGRKEGRPAAMTVLVLGPLHADETPRLFALTGTDAFDFDQLAPGAYRIGVQMLDQVAAPWLNSVRSTAQATVVAGKVTSTVAPLEAQ